MALFPDFCVFFVFFSRVLVSGEGFGVHFGVYLGLRGALYVVGVGGDRNSGHSIMVGKGPRRPKQIAIVAVLRSYLWGKKKTNKHKEFWRDTPWLCPVCPVDMSHLSRHLSLSRGHAAPSM